MARIVALPSLWTKREIRQLLGLLGYCRQWIEGYSEKVKFFYEKWTTDRLKWTQQDEEGFKQIKETLTAAPVLSLPDIKRQFQLFVDMSSHTAHGVLMQDWAGDKKPVGYVSKPLDPVVAHLSASYCSCGIISGGSEKGNFWSPTSGIHSS